MEINITKYTSTHNTTACSRNPEYIAIHYSAGTRSTAGSALSLAKYFSTTTVQASADFTVDDATIVQYNPDIKNRYCWAVGGNKYNTKGGSLYGKAKNANTISIEICSTNSTGSVKPANDPSWSFSPAALANAVKLVQYLMETYNIDISHVIRHYDVTGKNCPGIVGFSIESGSEAKWLDFKHKVQSDVSTTTPTPISGSTKYYRVFAGSYKNQPNAQSQVNKLKAAGFNAVIKNYGDLLRVQVAACGVKANADNYVSRLKAAGFSAFVQYD